MTESQFDVCISALSGDSNSPIPGIVFPGLKLACKAQTGVVGTYLVSGSIQINTKTRAVLLEQ